MTEQRFKCYLRVIIRNKSADSFPSEVLTIPPSLNEIKYIRIYQSGMISYNPICVVGKTSRCNRHFLSLSDASDFIWLNSGFLPNDFLRQKHNFGTWLLRNYFTLFQWFNQTACMIYFLRMVRNVCLHLAGYSNLEHSGIIIKTRLNKFNRFIIPQTGWFRDYSGKINRR